MKMLDFEDFLMEAGIQTPTRDMSLYDGKPYECACGKIHTFNASYMDYRNFATNGANALIVVTCPIDGSYSTLIKTKMKFLVVFDGFEVIAGNRL